MSQDEDVLEGRIALSSLDAADVVAVKAAALRKRFLAKAFESSQLTNLIPELLVGG